MTDVATIEQQDPVEEVQEIPAEERPVIKAEAARMFRWSEWLHLGEGAEECWAEAEKPGSCDDHDHFHAWVRLPNPYQHREIRERALAAQARRSRQLRDADSDSAVVLDQEIETLRAGGLTDPIIDQLVAKSFGDDYMQAINEVREEEKWERVELDQERYAVLDDMAEIDRPKDEYDELDRHLTAYNQAIEEQFKVIQEPKKEALSGLGIDELVSLLRDHRIEQLATEEYLHVFGLWEMVAGTYLPNLNAKKRPHKPVWGNPEEMRDEAPEVIEAVKSILDNLRVASQRALTGNS